MLLKVELNLEGTVLGNNHSLLNRIVSGRKITVEDIAMLLSDNEESIYDKVFDITRVDETMDSTANQAIFDEYRDGVVTRELPAVRTIKITVR